MEPQIRHYSCAQLNRLTRDLELTTLGSINVSGWVSKVRHSKKRCFIELRDGALEKDKVPVVYELEDHKDIGNEDFLQMYCQVVIDTEGRTKNGFELHCKKVLLRNKCERHFSSRVPDDGDLNLRIKERVLWLRKPQMSKIILINALVLKCIRKVFEGLNCTEIIPPMYGSVQCEGGSGLFEFEHMKEKAYLTQSSQFYLEACVPAVGNCYCIQPSFRNNESGTRRHLSSYTHVEFEGKDFNNFEDFVSFLENFIARLLEEILEQDGDGLLDDRREFITNYLNKGFMTLTHAEAIKILNDRGILKKDGTKFEKADDIPESQERQLIDELDQFVMLTKFPHEFKSFYMKREGDKVLGVDVEFPGVGEIIGSGVRVDNYYELLLRLKEQEFKDSISAMNEFLEGEIVEKWINESRNQKFLFDLHEKINTVKLEDFDNLKQELIMMISDNFDENENQVLRGLQSMIKTLDPADYEFYLDLRRYGFGMTAGFGLGFERFITWLVGAQNIKDVTTFPRYRGCLRP